MRALMAARAEIRHIIVDHDGDPHFKVQGHLDDLTKDCRERSEYGFALWRYLGLASAKRK